MTSGTHPSLDPHDASSATADSLPDEEHIDPSTVEDDLQESPEEKRNATDGYAPADDPDLPDTLELDELED
jgi:hypothetical protein